MVAKFITHFTLQILLLLVLTKIGQYILDLCGVPIYDNVFDLYNNSIAAWIVTIVFVVVYNIGTTYIKRFINFIQDK